jgi:hypothetical protein
MLPCRRLVGLLAAFALATAAPARADDALTARLHGLAAAWRAGDAVALAAAAARSERVRLDLHEIEGGRGSYAPGQLQAWLRLLFARCETLAFDFEADPREAGTDWVFARADWRWRPRAGGDEARATLTWALRREGGQWRLVEIRSSP